MVINEKFGFVESVVINILFEHIVYQMRHKSEMNFYHFFSTKEYHYTIENWKIGIKICSKTKRDGKEEIQVQVQVQLLGIDHMRWKSLPEKHGSCKQKEIFNTGKKPISIKNWVK